MAATDTIISSSAGQGPASGARPVETPRDYFLTVLIILTATDQKQLPRQMSASRMEPGAWTRDPDQ